jgi:hypothetical protein
MKHKLKDWCKRYVPPEIVGTLGALFFSLITFDLTGNRILSAYAGTVGENTGFYGFIFIREHIKDIKKSKNNRKKHGTQGFLKTIRNLFLEFGFSEFLDSFIVRPFCLYIFPI